ncbi:FAS1-like dehydratase domain-containing protein [Pseudodonghicola flavimaris]|uniref:MaoC family dehydratase N-terminal domain-containing protein n=1 Tax=Pseudodonghicola flavimaris TaxID=3050036 RepID=A0ABT7EXL4_9RHOB|nr:MaoC family dehydratase N-terminal domain-containing protein [Pseudodonghicola flavimaris]MDK3017083.1 MaoC family dehydratase N-terminal domain-containing protein [Pseudodonghicola flavimaris]
MTTAPLTDWIGRQDQHHDRLDPRPAQQLRSILPGEDSLAPGTALPPLWHWAYFPDFTPLSALGRDGHPARGGFLPPVALPRRMWAGGRLQFPGDLRIGDTVEKTSRILEVREKTGRSGALCFVTVEHRFTVAGDLRLIEEHDIVYRADPAPDAPTPVPPQADPAPIEEAITPSPVMLFRYSAATFNGHRIHYDPDYCRDVEGYPGLIFHGPLTATLLADLARRTGGRPLARFDFRAISPLYDIAPFTLRAAPGADGARVWAAGPDNALAMTAVATYR